uniref:Uncharacterized protein n=2 Tax=Paracidobacterium acidisoli TaxID=2303751 RepID=A0A372IQ36_9BACT
MTILTFAGCNDSTEYETPTPSRFQKTVIGKWESKDGTTVWFGSDGRLKLSTLLNICSIWANYNVSDFSDGTYVVENITHIVGSCNEKAQTGRGREKLDVLDSNHLLFGPLELTRSQDSQ